MATPNKKELLSTLKPAVPTPPAALKAHQEMARAFPQLRDEVVSVQVTDEDSYLHADMVLAKIRSTRKAWNERMEAIIRPIRTGLDHIYALNRDVDKPMELLEGQLKRAMSDYKTQERRQLEAAQRAKDEEDQRIADELARVQEAEAKARTAPMRAKLALAREALETQQQIVAEEPVSAPVQANHSTTRVVKKIRVIHLKMLLMAIVAGKVPMDAIAVNQVALNSYLKLGPDNNYLPVSEWPGVETYDDTQIVGR